MTFSVIAKLILYYIYFKRRHLLNPCFNPFVAEDPLGATDCTTQWNNESQTCYTSLPVHFMIYKDNHFIMVEHLAPILYLNSKETPAGIVQ